MGSQPGGSNHTPVVDWVAVWIMLIGTVFLGLALPFKSWWLAGVGAVLFAIGAGIAMAYGIMNHTEDYEVRPRPQPEATEPPAAGQTPRIISA